MVSPAFFFSEPFALPGFAANEEASFSIAVEIWLNSSAKAKAPGAAGSDFDYGVLIGGIRHSRLIWPEIGVSRMTVYNMMKRHQLGG